MSIDIREGAKEPINPKIKEACDRIGWQMDKVIDTFDMYTDPDPNFRFPVRHTSPNPYTTVMRNTMHLSEVLKGRDPWRPYPKMADVSFIMKSVVENVPEQNPEDAISVGVLQEYGKLLKRIYPQLAASGLDPVKGLKEVLATDFRDTDLFIAVKDSITQEEGFVPELVQEVQAIDKNTLKRSRPDILIPHYEIFETDNIDTFMEAPELDRLLAGVDDPVIKEKLKTYWLMRREHLGESQMFVVHWEGKKDPRITIGGHRIDHLDPSLQGNTGGIIGEDINKGDYTHGIGGYYAIIQNGGRYGDEQLVALFTKPLDQIGDIKDGNAQQ